MKKILICTLSAFGIVSSAQVVSDTIEVNVPYIGKNGGAHILGWNLAPDTKNIHLYAYSHTNGNQLVSTPEAIKEAKAKHDEKSWLGKLLENGIRENLYQFTIIPLVAEVKIDPKNKQKQVAKEWFHKVDDVPKDHRVYFVQGSGVLDLGGSFVPGEVIPYHYKDLNLRFKQTPTFPKEILNFLHIEYKGEGALGLKNIAPHLVRKRAEFTYDNSKGFFTKTETTSILNYAEHPDLAGSNFIQESNNINKGVSVAWFANKDENTYTQMYFNDKENATKSTVYAFENSREIKVMNTKIFTQDFKGYGFLSIFGYHKRQNKKAKQYTENEFDIIITGIDGKEISRKLVTFGDKNAYKNILNPLQVFYHDGKLKILNLNFQSAFKKRYELLTYDIETGTLESGGMLEREPNTNEDAFRFANDFLYETDASYHFGKNKVFIKKVEGNLDPNNMQSAKVNIGFNVLVLNENYQPIGHNKFRDVIRQKNGKETPIFQIIHSSDKEMVILGNQGSSYYLIKIDEAGNVKTDRIQTPYELTAESLLYFGNNELKPALVDIENRKIYLMNQYYTKYGYNDKVISKIGISVVDF